MNGTIVWTELPDKTGKDMTQHSGTWADFQKRLSTVGHFPSKDKCPWLKMARFGITRSAKGSLRTNENVIDIFGIEGDYDGEVFSIEDARAQLQAHGIKAAFYPSASHTPDKPRWRVLCPLSTPHLPAERAGLVARLNGSLNGILTNESFTLSQGFFFGATPTNDYQVSVTDGVCIDELPELDAKAIGKPDHTKKSAATGQVETLAADERHAAQFKNVLSGDEYHTSLRDLAASMVATGMQAGAVVNHLRGLMDNSTGAHDERWAARREQIPELVDSAVAKFVLQPVDFSALHAKIDPASGEVQTPQSDEPQDVSIGDIATFAPTPPQFWVDELLPADVVTLLGAHGGAGKTTLAIIAAVCCAVGLPFLGKATKPAKVLLYSAEDDTDLLRWRLSVVCQRLNVDPVALAERLTVVDASDSEPVMFVEARRNGVTVGEATAAFKKLIERMAAQGTQIVILDNASDVYGADENNRGQVRGFIRLLGKLVRPNHGAVLLLAHVDKLTARTGGSQGYSGSTAWHNSVRSRLFLSNDKDDLTLEHQKSNRGQRADPMRLIWDRGLPTLAQEVQGANGTLKPLVDQMRINTVLALIDEFYRRGEWISTSATAHTNAFKMLNGEVTFPKGMSKSDLWQLLRDAERRGVLVKEAYKNISRNECQRWRVLTAASLQSHEETAVSA